LLKGGEAVRRKNVTILLVLGLVALTAVGCAGNEQSNENNTQNQATDEDTQQAGKAQKEKHDMTRAEDSSGENAGGKARGRKATLKLQGEPGTEFSGSCAVGDQEPEEISGQVPESFTYKLKGKPLDCKISSDGDVQVDLTIGKNVHSVQRISGGTLNLTYENGSVSSVVSSSSGSSVQGSSVSSQGGASNGSGNVTSESRDVSGFNEVELNGVGNLSIQQTGSESLTVEAEEDAIPKIKAEVVNNRLVIGPKPNTTVNTTEPINYKLTVKDLNALKLSGSGKVNAEGIDTDKLAVTVNGAGEVKMAGRAESQDVHISGSGNYQAGDLESKAAKIALGGSGSATVNASDELDTKVSGSGSVEYTGDPTVSQDVSGAGRVRKQ
jgi:putative autotransporter adhesin-like protein